ncbi:type II secretion system protein, partial [Arthrospira platensis SPKY1]|nr:type II secretion system protein [Arthrospira platensis SPKY1]
RRLHHGERREPGLSGDRGLADWRYRRRRRGAVAMSRRIRQHGFSLLEVLVAFAILSISLGAILQVFATGLRNAGMADDYTRATLYAESILAAIGREASPGAGVREGPIDD